MPDPLPAMDNPYEAPRARVDDPFVEVDAVGSRTFNRDPRFLASLLKALLWIYIVVQVITFISNGFQIALLYRAPFSEEEGTANDLRQGAISILYLIVFVITAIVFLKWIARSHRNARGFGAVGLTYSPNFAAGSFFIPILNLFRPYQAMKELWKASRRPTSWQIQPVSPIVGIWWTVWIINNLLGQISMRVGSKAETIDQLIYFNYFSLFTNVFDVVLAIVAMMLVGGIDRMQRAWVDGVADDGSHGPESDPFLTPEF